MTRTQIYLSSAEIEGVKRLAAETGRRRSEIMREALDQYLRQHMPQDQLRQIREAQGIWKGRTGLTSLAAQRKEFDRFY